MTEAPEHTAKLVRASLLDQLAKHRQARGLKQEELASRAGMSRMTVVRMEAADSNPGLDSFIRAAIALNMQVRLEGDEVVAPGQASTHPADIIHRGLSYRRTQDNKEWRDRQREAALAKAWEAANLTRNVGLAPVMPALVPQHTQEQASAVATAIQWLGSEVGFDFLVQTLRRVGYEVVDTQANPAAKNR